MRLLCDFCCSRDDEDVVAWEYPCRTFDVRAINGLGATSHGSWAACKKCYELIQENKLDELTERSLEKFRENDPVTASLAPDIMKMSIKHLHNSFFRNRFGVPKRVTKQF